MVPVSAVVVAYNEEKYIAGCLESIMAQTVSIDEVLLLNDGSTDRTEEIASRYPIEIYEVDYHSYYPLKRMSVCVARNDVVLAVDGDTELAPDFLMRGLHHLEEGYDAATGRILSIERTPSGDIAAFVANALPKTTYYSGPGYVLDRRGYMDACQVKRVNGYVDICMDAGEIPLEKLNIVKDQKMIMYTELPSTGQKRMINGARAVGGVLTALKLLSA